MAEVTADRIKRLVAGSELEKAAELLEQTWRGKDEPLHNLAIALTERLGVLNKETLQNVLSRSEAELERARIIDGLLFLANRLENPKAEAPRHLQEHIQTTQEKTANRKWILAAAGALLLLAIGYFSVQSNLKPADFNVKVFLHGPEGLTAPVADVPVKLAFGDYQLSPRTTDEQGRVDFTDIPAKFANDSIQLILLDTPYEVVRQSATTAAQSKNESITFELKPLVQWTNWRGTLKDANGKPVANATLDIESGLANATTDANGNFSVRVPRASGERVQVTGYLEGEQVLNSSFVLTEQIPTQIQIKEP